MESLETKDDNDVYEVKSVKKPVDELTVDDYRLMMEEARARKRYDISDFLRDYLIDLGFRISFYKNGTIITWARIANKRKKMNKNI